MRIDDNPGMVQQEAQTVRHTKQSILCLENRKMQGAGISGRTNGVKRLEGTAMKVDSANNSCSRMVENEDLKTQGIPLPLERIEM